MTIAQPPSAYALPAPALLEDAPPPRAARAKWARWLRAAAVAIVPLLPVAAELLARRQPSAALTPYLVAYAVALAAFALVVPSTPPLRRLPIPVTIRWPLVGIALAAAAAGLALGLRDIRGQLLVPVWGVGVAAWLLAWWRPTVPHRVLAPRYLAIPLVVIALGGAVRVVGLDATPLQWDELFRTEFVQRHMDDTLFGPPGNFFFDQRPDTPSSITMPGVYLRAFIYRTFGIDYTTLRIVSALAGTLDLLLTYLAARMLFGSRAALVATAVLATLTVHLAFSRNALDTVEGSVVWSWVGLGLAIGFARRSLAAFAMVGLGLALGLQTYPSAHVAFAFVLAVMVASCVDPQVRGRWLLWASLAILGGLAVGMGPLMAAYYRNPWLFSWNYGYTNWLSTALAAYRVSGSLADLAPLWEHAWSALLGYNLQRNLDYNYRPERAFFLALPAALLFAGVAVTSARLLDWRHRLLALWFWGPTLGLSAMSAFPPDGHRSLPGFAACAILIGLAFDRALAGWESLVVRGRSAILALATIGLGVFLGAELWFYMSNYRYADLSPYEDKLARYTLSTALGRHLALFNASPVHFALFFATDVGRRNNYDLLVQSAGQLPDTRTRPVGVTYLVSGLREGWAPVVRDLYPAARETKLQSSDARVLRSDFFLPVRSAVMWTAFEVDPPELERHHGLALRLTDARGRTVDLRTASVRLPERLPDGLTYPIAAEWRGWLQHDLYDGQPDRFVSQGTVVPELHLGSIVETPSTSLQNPTILELPRGGVPVRATARLESPDDSVHLQWDGFTRRDAGEVEATMRQVRNRAGWRDFPLEQASVWPDAPRVLIEWIGEDGQRVVRRDYDSMIADLTLNRRGPLDAPSVRLSAELEVRTPGSYELRVDSEAGPVRLSVDGRQLWPPATGEARGPVRVATWLTVGRHPIMVERSTKDGGGAELSWRAPRSSDWSIVPPQAYVPMAWP